MSYKVLFYFTLLFFLIVFAPESNAGLFDDRFPSARATAMGGSGVAVANDLWAAYYNPAGLPQLEQISIGTSYLRLFNVSFLSNFFGVVNYPFPGKYGTASVTFQYFGVDVLDNLWILAIPITLSILLNILLVELYTRYKKKNKNK